MNVPFVNLAAGYEELRVEIDTEIDHVLRSGCYILGPQVEAFEAEFAAYVGAKYAVGVDSGSSALELSLLALGIGPGDEVVTVSHTFVATVGAVTAVGATPVLVDIDPQTYTMDVGALERALGRKTKAVIPVHLYGQPAAMDKISYLAGLVGAHVVEDACESHGAAYKGTATGAWGDCGCFSFYPTKNLGGYGDGGAVTANDPGIAERIRMLRNYGQVERYHHIVDSRNRRLDELQAAILRVKLKRLTEWNARRWERALWYHDSLEGTQCVLPYTDAATRTHVFHVYPILHPGRDGLQKFLRERGVETLIHYPVPVHRQPCYDRGIADSGLLVTDRVTSQQLSLPMYPHLPLEHIHYAAKCIKEFENGSD